MGAERSLYDQAFDAMERALVAHGSERQSLVEEAVRLHRLARAEALKSDPANLLAPKEPDDTF